MSGETLCSCVQFAVLASRFSSPLNNVLESLLSYTTYSTKATGLRSMCAQLLPAVPCAQILFIPISLIHPHSALFRFVFAKNLADYRKKMEANLKVQRAQRMLDTPGEPRKVRQRRLPSHSARVCVLAMCLWQSCRLIPPRASRFSPLRCKQLHKTSE